MRNTDTPVPTPAEVEPSAGHRGIWRQPDLLKVLGGETVSDLGSHVGGLALPLAAALTLGATPGQMAALRAASYVPRVLVGLVAGVWIDRLPRRPVLIATNAVRAVLLLVVAALAASGVLRVEMLYGAEIVMAALAVVFNTALAAYLPSLVPARSLVAANGVRATSNAATEVAGPGLAGILIQVLGVPGALVVDGLSFLASVAGVSSVRTVEPPPPPRDQRRRLDAELREGLGTLARQPVLRAFAATAVTANFFYSIVMAIYILYLTRDLGLSPAALGVIFGLGGGGGVLLGSAVASSVSQRLGLGPTLVGSHALFGLFGLLLASATVWPAFAVPLVFAAELLQLSVNAVYMVNRTGVEQAVTPPHLRGRVEAGRTVAHATAGTVGILVGGVLGEWFGTGAAIWVGVGGGLFSFLWLWRAPVRDLRVVPAEG